MPPIFCLAGILTDFRPLFNRQNFHLFCIFIVGLISPRHCATLTGIYQAVRPQIGYYSLVKFLSRGKGDADKEVTISIKLLAGELADVIAGACLRADSTEDIVLIARQHILIVIG